MIGGLSTRFPSSVQQPCTERFQRGSRSSALVVLGALAILTLAGNRAQAMQAQPDWWDELSPAGFVNVSASRVSRSEAQEYLDRLGLVAGAVPDPEVNIYGSGAFHGVQEARADWGTKRLELNGKFALRQVTEVLGQAMTVTAVLSSHGLLTTDDRGGTRLEAYRRFPVATCYRGAEGADCNEVVSFDAAWDDHGTIVEFIRNGQGLPSGVRFGEALGLRYDFTPPLPDPPGLAQVPAARWRAPSSWELIDLRTSEIVIDSLDAERAASKRPYLSVGLEAHGEAIRIEGGEPFVAAQGRLGWPYALMSLERPSEVWRIVYASGDMSLKYHYRVDYTDDLLRVEIEAGEYGRSIVVQAPRRRESAAPVSLVHPDAKLLTEALRSGSRLRAADASGSWLDSSFDKKSLPIVLRPFGEIRSLEIKGPEDAEVSMTRATARSEQSPEAAGMAPEFEFGAADECEEENGRLVCLGGESVVIGEESPYPW